MAQLDSSSSDRNAMFSSTPSYRRLRVNWFEAVLVAAMLVVLVTAGLDVTDGRHIGKDNRLTIARQQGQPELMAEHASP